MLTNLLWGSFYSVHIYQIILHTWHENGVTCQPKKKIESTDLPLFFFFFFLYLKKFKNILIWEGQGERDRQTDIDIREKHQLVASHLCPDWELNLQPFGVWDDTPTNWAIPARATTILFKSVFLLRWNSHSKIIHFRVNNSVTSSTITVFCSLPLCLVSKHFLYSKRKPCTHEQSQPTLLPQPLTTSSLLSVSMDLPILDI